ncbi:Peptidoglycan/LPS O-acetylase OafA/YrhL, contains acyltransferase and SGNH-hydrolase domains [Hymenobacter gelipurpurascens]|uniref:Peptidoglycan/LPS O-acetylase OafA/YrhL, contains acyltransferase and SGNH-hydrolase domains n=1 Tax=Hymenobacter gelipurpurascens TaxID=89968 RepID=A0A212UB53_9BACT|nr:acyltransferase [Hymenobacter gelipurpurascens]SNC75518.1 Peptidoglycan/LPS O-acetylase OafA/YrhL, contains acyltransferase and SGNH-hydrolase domains [Hymenobacter gelipurpurascens]
MQNNFDAVRLSLALIVVLCHLAVLSEVPAFQPFLTYLSADFAVKGFFVISGCLVTRSFLSSASGLEYAEKRARRIYPAYFVTICVAWLIGLAATTLPVREFLHTPATYKHLLANASFLNFLQPTLPGVFEQHPVPVMNASLWTIKVELCLYGCVPVLVLLFRRMGPYATMLLAFAVALSWELLLPHIPGLSSKMQAELGRQFPGALHLFALGALFTIEEQRLGHYLGRIALASVLAFWLLHDSGLRLVVEPVCYAACVLFLATRLPFRIPVGQWGDLSYGTYLLHFPLIQLFIALGSFHQQSWGGLALLLLVVLGAAFLLWHSVEKPFLKRNSHYVPAENVTASAKI